MGGRTLLRWLKGCDGRDCCSSCRLLIWRSGGGHCACLAGEYGLVRCVGP